MLKRANGTWTKEPRIATNMLADVWASGTDDVWAVGRGGLVLHYDGTRWTDAWSGTNRHLEAVHGTSRTDMYVVGEDRDALKRQ